MKSWIGIVGVFLAMASAMSHQWRRGFPMMVQVRAGEVDVTMAKAPVDRMTINL
jgi:hypothetical protein